MSRSVIVLEIEALSPMLNFIFLWISTDYADYTEQKTTTENVFPTYLLADVFFQICVICVISGFYCACVICGFHCPCKNFNTAALNSAAFSNCGTCPHWSITSRVEFGISFLSLSPSASGVNPSSRPHTTSVGCLIDLTRLSRKSSPRMMDSMMLLIV